MKKPPVLCGLAFSFLFSYSAAATDFSITIGATVTNGVPGPGAGDIELPGETDTYTFSGARGQRVYFDTQVRVWQIYWQLLDPDGTQVFNNHFWDGEPGAIGLAKSGVYRIRVYGGSDFTGAYVFKIWHAPPAEEFAIAIGDTVSSNAPAAGAGHIETPGVRDTYTFPAASGQRVFFDTQLRAWQIYWQLLDPDGAEVFNNHFWDADPGAFTLLKSGNYTIRAYGNADNVGAYGFKLWNVPLPEQFNIVIGDMVNTNAPASGAGNIETPGVSDVYLFTNAPGQTVFFHTQGSSPNFSVRWAAYDVNGNRLFDNGLTDADPGYFTLPTAGVNRIVAYGSGQATGTYAFRLWNVPVPNTFAIALNETITNNFPGAGAGGIETPGGEDFYSFTNAAGQTVFFDMLSSNPNFTVRWAVFDALGNRLFDDWLSNGDPGSFVLPGAGTNTLRLYGSGQSIGSYSFKVWTVPAHHSFSLAVGTTVSNASPSFGAGNLEQPGAEDVYWFTNAPGQAVYFDARGSIPANTVRWAVFDAQNNRLFDHWLSDGDPGKFTLPVGGAHRIRVYGGGQSAQIGTYAFAFTNTTPDTPPVTSADRFVIAPGDTVTNGVPGSGAGNIEANGTQDVYEFSAAAGQIIFIEDRGSADGSLRLDLYDPNGNFITWEPLNGHPDIGHRTLTKSGVYRAVLSGPNGATGTYSFKLWGIAPNYFKLPYGTFVSSNSPANGAGVLENPGALDVYDFAATAGQTLFIADHGSAANSVRVDLYDPNGNFVTWEWLDNNPNIGQRTLAESGSYRIYAYGTGHSLGAYSFRLQNVVPDAFTIALGDLVSGNSPGPGAGQIESPGALDRFEVNVGPGQLVFLEDLGSSGGQVRIDFYDPAGSFLFWEWLDGGNSVGRRQFTEAGTYRFYVYGNGNATGNYSFRLRAVAPDQHFDIALDQLVTSGVAAAGAGQLESPGAYDIYRLSVAAGQLVYFEDLGAESAINWIVYDEAGGTLFNDRLDGSDPGRRLLTHGGTYTIYAYPASAATSDFGAYSFRVRSVPPDQYFSLAIGETVMNGVPAAGAGNLEASGVNDIYTFNAPPGQLIYFEDLGAQSQMDWAVYDETGTQLFADRLNDSDPGRRMLTRGGRYTIYVYPAGADPAHFGIYSFRLRAIPSDDRFSISVGDIVADGVPGGGAGKIEAPGANDVYTFTAAPNQLVYFDDLGGASTFDWAVYDEAGAQIFGDRLDGGDPGARTLTRGGTYTIYVYPAGASITYTGAYSFRLWSELPRIVSQPQSRRGLIGLPQTFSVLVQTAFPPLRLQWRHNGASLPSATNSILTLSSPSTDDSGAYDVVVSNPHGSVTSVVATLTLEVSDLFVTSFAPVGSTPNNVSSLRVQFNRPINATTLTTADIVVRGPGGTLNSGQFSITPIDAQTFNIAIPSQSVPGTYTIELGPAVTNQSGVPMTGGVFVPLYATDFETGVGAEWGLDANQTAPVTTRFLGQFDNHTATLTLTHLPAHTTARFSWDLLVIDSWDGDSGGPDYWGFHVDDRLTPEFEYTFKNWEGHSPQSFPGLPAVGSSNFIGNAGYLDALYRDLEATFPHTNDQLRLSFYGRNLQGIPDESWGLDNPRLSLATPGNGTFLATFTIDKTGASVVEISSAGTNRTPVSQLEFSFDEAVRPASVNTNTVQLTGPLGPIGLVSLQRLSTARYLATFAPQRGNGIYTLTVGPDILDAAGNVMNQDGDGVNGEPGTDVFTSTFHIRTPPLITSGPQSQTVVRNNNVSLTVVASSTPPATYRWSFNGAPIAGATSPELALTSVQPAQSGVYQVAVTDGGGTALSSPANLTVLQNYGPLIATTNAASTGIPPVPGDGVAIELFNGMGGGAVPVPALVTNRSPDGTTLSPVVDFPRPGAVINVGSSFDTFFANTTIPPEQVSGLSARNFTLRFAFWLKVTRELDVHLETPEIDLQLGVGSDDGFYLLAGANYIGSASDRGFTYSWMDVSFEDAGLYPITLYFAANAVGQSGLELSWNTATTGGNQIIPQSALYLTPNPADRLITFEELPVGSVLSNQFASEGILFRTVGGSPQVTTNYPTQFVPVSAPRVFADPRTSPTERGEVELTFTLPGTETPATTTFLSFFLIDAETTGATVAAFDSDGTLVFTNEFHAGGASQLLVSIANPRLARVRLTLGQGADTVAVDNLRFTSPTPENHRPVFAPIGNRTIDEGATLTFAAMATDADADQSLSFSLVGAPAGASIQSSNGVFVWTPSEDQGPGSYPIVVRATDNAAFPLSGTNTFTVTVNEVNLAPTLTNTGVQHTGAGRTVQFLATASDPDLPPQTLAFSLGPGAPPEASIDPSSGVITWPVPANQPPGNLTIPIRVADNGTPPLSATQSVTIVVDNLGPRVTAMRPTGSLSNPVDHVDFTFSEPIAGASFTPADVAITGPVTPVVTTVANLSNQVWRASFAPVPIGTYAVNLGPNIADLAGNPMNQNADSINGEIPGDIYTASFTVALPDLRVVDLRFPSVAHPGQTVALSWTVTNSGNAIATGPFSQSVYLAGSTMIDTESLLVSLLNTNSLPPGGSLTETQRVNLSLTGPAGVLHFAVEADSDRAVGEANETNNLSIATGTTTIPAILTLQISTGQVREDASPATIFVTLTRNGDPSAPLNVSLNSSASGELSVPANVPIPAGQSSIGFNVTVHPDGAVDGDRLVNLTASAAGYGNGTAAITVLDVDQPNLHLALSASSVSEGEAVFATLRRDGDTSSALEVQVTTSSAVYISTPTTVTIPAGATGTNFLVEAPDNNLVENTRTFGVTASAMGYRPVSADLIVQDNDRPTVTLALSSTNISEGAGTQAILATVRRSPTTARGLLLDLESADTNALRVPARVTIPAGLDAVSFPVAAVDDDLVDGPQQTTLRTFVRDSTTGARLADAASILVTVEDDDGPTLRVTLAAKLVAEGLNPATTATVTRNTGTAGDLNVMLTSSHTNEAIVPDRVLIPSGQSSATFAVRSVDDGVTDGPQRVIISATASNYTSGSEFFTVSDVDLPDLVASRVSGPATATTEGFVTAAYRLLNQGATAAGPTNFTTRLLLSRDPVVGDDIFLGQYSFTGTIPPGQSFEQAVSVRLPQTAGEYWVVAEVDIDNALSEVLEDNNSSISATPIQVRAAHIAAVATDINVAPSGPPVLMYGTATVPGTSEPPPVSSLVNIHLRVRGTHRVISALTDEDGNFSASWRPLPGEAGFYEIGAAHPGDADAPTQDTFTLVGLRVMPAELDLQVVEHGSVTGHVVLENLSTVALTGLNALVVEKPANVNVTLSSPPNLPGDASGVLRYSISAMDAGVAGGLVRARVTSSEGATNEIVFNVTVEALRPRFVVNPPQLVAGMRRGGQTIVEFEVANLGGTNSGPLSLLTPALPWLHVASTNPLPPLAPGVTNRITIQLTPAATLPLGEYTGAMALTDGSNTVSVPFNFRALSDLSGDLQITAVDEFTFYAAGSPPVSNATVVVRDAVSHDVLTNGVAGPDGRFFVSRLSEGYYDLEVNAPQHIGFRQTALLLAGRTNTVEAFLSRETVQYRWTVVPTEVQDRTRISIETTFETVVPAPVVTIEPAMIDLADITADVTQIELKIQNHGLIAAHEFTLNFGGHPEWQFTPLISEFGTLPARSSMTIPLTIRRLRGGGGGSAADSGDGGIGGGGGGPCSIPASGCWTLICGVKRGYCAGIAILNAGGNCGGRGGLPGGGIGGFGGAYFSGPSFSPKILCDCKDLPKICLGGNLSADLDGVAAKMASMVLRRLPSFRLVKNEAKVKADGKLCSCCTSKNEISYEGSLTGSVDIEVVLQAGPGFVAGFQFDPPAGWADLRAEVNALAGVEVTVKGSVGYKLEKKCGDQKPHICFFGQASAQLFSGAQLKAEVSLKNVANNITYGGGIDGAYGLQGGLTAKVDGCSDTGIRFELCGELKAIAHLQGSVKGTLGPGQLDIQNIGINGDQTLASVGNCEQGGGSPVLFFPAGIAAGSPGQPDVEIVPADEFVRPEEEVTTALLGSFPPQSGVCAKVKLKLDQEAVLTRDAFKATLELLNESGVPLTDIGIDVTIKDASGRDVTSLFGFRPPELNLLSGVDGAGILDTGLDGSASWILIPSVDAAPDAALTYFVGGTLRFTQAGTPVAVPLAPAPITVHPLPQLNVNYFHQRDVFSDDPFTDEVEPSIPYSLAVLIQNSGQGTARNLRITSAQPQIVENEKGLLIDFKIIATEVAGQNLVPSLTANFGDIGPGQTSIGRWLLTSTLQGLFIDYKASFENLDIMGKSRLAIITNVAIHELTHQVWATGAFDDGQPDFLVNQVPDAPFALPDTLHLSDASVASVSVITNGTVSGTLSPGNLAVTLHVTMPGGWTYVRVPDPGDGQYRLTRVVRSDGAEIPFGTNVWTTDRTFIGFGRRPTRENVLHLFDRANTASYTLYYRPPEGLDTMAPESSIAAMPARSFPLIPVSWSGTDNAGGRGLAYFDIYVSEDGAPYALWLQHTTERGGVYSGTPGNHYAFYSVSTDNAGNREAAPATADAQTTADLVNTAPVLAVGANRTVNEGDTVLINNTATDSEAPLNIVTFSLGTGSPPGAVITPTTGRVSWPTGEANGPSTNRLTIIARDNGIPSLSATGSVVVVVNEVNSPPVLAAIANQRIKEGSLLTVTNAASDSDLPSQSLTFSLGLDSPVGMDIDPVGGLLTWRPSPTQGGTTNRISVIVRDNGIPSLSATQTFLLNVRDALPDFATTIGGTNLFAGESSSVSIRVDSGLELTAISFTLDLPVPGLTNLSLRSTAAEIQTATIQATDSNRLLVRLETGPGASMVGSANVAAIHFDTLPNAASAMVPLHLSGIEGTLLDGTRLIAARGNGGRVILVGEHPLVEALIGTNGGRSLILYGRPGRSYAVQSTTNLAAPTIWHSLWEIELTGRFSLRNNLPALASTTFYRAYELTSPAGRLSIRHEDGNAVIEWPTLATGCVLQETTSLTHPSNWARVAAPVGSSGDRFRAVVPLGGGNRFFRLSCAP